MRPSGLSLLTALVIVSLAGCAQPRREFPRGMLCHPTYVVGTLYCHDLPDAVSAGPSEMTGGHRAGDYPDLQVGAIRCPDRAGDFIPRVLVLNATATAAGPFDVVVDFALETVNPSTNRPESMRFSVTRRVLGVPGNTRVPVDFGGLTIPVIENDTLTISVTVDPALVAPDWLLWGKVNETDETNNSDSRQCDPVP